MNSAEIVLEALPLSAIAEDATAGCQAAAADKGLDLAIDISACEVLTHRDMLATILRNLVGNAIKFTPAGGSVRIVGAPDGQRVRVSIVDTGVGMTAEICEALFRIDQRRSSLGTAGERGSGLGLLLCHDLAARLGTTLEVASTPGQGTTFSLHLPCA